MDRAERGCLVIHGLTGTPAVVKSLTNALLENGFFVRAPLLAGHGTRPEALFDVTWRDWYRSVVGAYQELRLKTKKICCVGVSLGSLLGLKLAIDWHWGIRALCCISTPMKLSTFVHIAFPLVWKTPIKHIYKFQTKDYAISVADSEGRKEYMQSSYDRMPLRSVAELRVLQSVLKKESSQMTTPLLLIHAKQDAVAPISNLDEVKRMVKSTVVERLVLERSQHVITLDCEKDIAAKTMLSFFERFL